MGTKHYRIISKGSSEGFSPWFLLLGSTSSASGMLNMCAWLSPRCHRGTVLIYAHRVVMQHTVIKCCRFYVSRLANVRLMTVAHGARSESLRLPRDRSWGHSGRNPVVFVFCHVRSATRNYCSPCRLTGPPSLVLYMLYFPPHLKSVTLDIDADELGPSERIKTDLKSDTWRLSITLSWIVVVHLSVFHRFQASHSRVSNS